MKQGSQAMLKEIVAMTLFGSIGLFVKYIPLQSSVIALTRAVIGMFFLLLITAVKKQKIHIQSVRNNLLWLGLSGSFLGFNWICLFEAYRYTSVAVSTLCYYMAPIFVMLAAPFLLKERLTVKKLLCILCALCGMLCISGVLRASGLRTGEWKGIAFGLGGAVLYASVILCNKKIKAISPYDRTIVQLAISAAILLPYCVLTHVPTEVELTLTPIIILLIVGVVHTGLTYFLYFGSIEELSAQTVAIISYVDPLVAVLLSATLLKEPFQISEVLGTVLILGAAVVSELPQRKND